MDRPLTDTEMLNELTQMGKEGKLWTLTICFTLDGETKQDIKRNLKSREIMKLRTDLFQVGFLHPISAGRWRIVMPLDIDRVYLDRQSGYFSG
jgi:hypothetical protein